MATNTEDNPRILLVSSAQYNEPQQAAATTKQIAAQKNQTIIPSKHKYIRATLL